jgi:hypothetical protein
MIKPLNVDLAALARDPVPGITVLAYAPDFRVIAKANLFGVLSIGYRRDGEEPVWVVGSFCPLMPEDAASPEEAAECVARNRAFLPRAVEYVAETACMRRAARERRIALTAGR